MKIFGMVIINNLLSSLRNFHIARNSEVKVVDKGSKKIFFVVFLTALNAQKRQIFCGIESQISKERKTLLKLP